MNSWRTKVIAIFRLLMALVLVITLSSCGEKAVTQEPSGSLQKNSQSSLKQIREVSPPASIQELRLALEDYQPQVTIVTPTSDEVLQDNTVTVRFQVKDLPIFKDSQLGIGPHLHVILDNEPYITVYDLNQPLILSDLSPGTHTLRAFAERPWNESFKNEGAYSQIKFHIFTLTDDNNPDPAQPLLTYSSPSGSYGAEPILLDFYLTNAPLHLVAQEKSEDQIADWRIRCTINGESFVLDRWQSVYLKGFKPGKNWVKLEFLDEQGNPVKNVFNSTLKLITYEPKGNDTLSQIVRGEISTQQARAIVDPNYREKTPVVEPTPTVTPTVEPTPEIQNTEPTPIPTPSVTPTVEPIPETQKEEQKPIPETESQEVPQKQVEKPKSGFFNRRRAGKIPTPQETVTPTPSVSPALPKIIESPQPEVTPQPEATTVPETPQPQPEETKEAEPTPIPEVAPQREEKRRWRGFFNRRGDLMRTPQETPTPSGGIPTPQETVKPSPKGAGILPTPQETVTPTPGGEMPTPQESVIPTPSLPPTLPEIVIESPQPQTTAEPQPEVTPDAESTTLPEKIAPDPEKPELKRYFNPNQFPNAAQPPSLPQTQPEVDETLKPEAPETTLVPEQLEREMQETR